MPLGARSRRLLLASAAAISALFLLAFCVGPPWYYVGKYAPSDSSALPTALPDNVVPEVQTEPHTCGLHTLSSIYRAYGLDGEAQRLRFRLGTDKPFTNFLADSTGTIHPDMLRVLRQDGFRAQILFPSAAGASARFTGHLRRGHVAAALTKVSEFHWVALSAADDGDSAPAAILLVCDSLHEQPYERDIAEYVEESVYSLILIEPERE
jgi:hypothetical protein